MGGGASKADQQVTALVPKPAPEFDPQSPLSSLTITLDQKLAVDSNLATACFCK